MGGGGKGGGIVFSDRKALFLTKILKGAGLRLLKQNQIEDERMRLEFSMGGGGGDLIIRKEGPVPDPACPGKKA